MQILVLSLISILLASCNGGKKTDNWKAPNVYYLRADGNKNKVLSNNEDLQLNDSIYFSEKQYSEPSPEDVKKDDTAFNVLSDVKCVSTGKSFVSTNSYRKNNIKLKEILPIEASLYPQEIISCQISIQLQNSSGSTKTFKLPERSIDLRNFPVDFSLKENVNHQEFHTIQIFNLKSAKTISLVCDAVLSQITNSGANSIALDQLTSKLEKMHQDILQTQYKPHQICRVVIRLENEKLISNKFKIQFEKSIPEYSYVIHKNYRDHARLYLYELKLSNPYDFPVSIALYKPALQVPLSLSKQIGAGSSDYSQAYTDQATLSISDSTKIIDKENVSVIFLMPGESIQMQAYKESRCDGSSCVYSKVTDKNLPIYNLEYNFRSIEEIQKNSEVNILDQISAN